MFTQKTQVSPLPATQIRTLLIDDDYFLCELISAYLQRLGITQIDVLHEGAEAAAQLCQPTPSYQLILCDWQLPGNSGLEIYNSMRASGQQQEAHFILVTGVDDRQQIRQALALGIDHCLIKPINQQSLQQALQRFFPSLAQS